MRTPFLLLGVAILFWGLYTWYLIPAIIMILLYEGARFVRIRWNLADHDFKRISDFCTLLFVILLAYLIIREWSADIILTLLKMLPMVLFPIVIAQRYSTERTLNLSALFYTLRKKKNDTPKKKSRSIRLNLSYPYYAVCALSAGIANSRDGYFYLGFIILTIPIFWQIRSKRFSILWFLGYITLAGLIGIPGYQNLNRLQLYLEGKDMEWFGGFSKGDSDPFKTKTSIGDIGALKPSNRIMFRVAAADQTILPLLLQEASYNIYHASRWLAVKSDFKSIRSNDNHTEWTFEKSSQPDQTIVIMAGLNKGEGLIKLPKGAFKISQLKAVSLGRNGLGTIKVEGGPGMAVYRIHFGPSVPIASPPNKFDLMVPDRERTVCNNIVKKLALKTKTPEKILTGLSDFFNDNFKYSLIQKKTDGEESPITHFLTRSRKGHCEFFATASILLLRTAGIPARYAKGYSAHEYSEMENRYIVRDRHAHSWALAYVNGRWHNFDTTPSTWAEMESQSPSSWSTLSDLWSLIQFKVSHWWWHKRNTNHLYLLWLMLIPLFIILFRRFKFKKPIRKNMEKENRKNNAIQTMHGLDSEFYYIVNELKQLDIIRDKSETLSSWLNRVSINHPQQPIFDELQPILTLHYQYRFDPLGLPKDLRFKLKSDSESWLDRYRKMGI